MSQDSVIDAHQTAEFSQTRQTQPIDIGEEAAYLLFLRNHGAGPYNPVDIVIPVTLSCPGSHSNGPNQWCMTVDLIQAIGTRNT
ncbi:hypothetical protein H2248_005525 [Termitomyces sp. 'cryptogamus']|nr:hypothetical protein H2248_005525 [Termitomyces sp. 'cryptogamus']